MELPHTPAALRDHPSQEGREQKHILMVDMHHIISDGTSLGILVKEFITLYQEESLPPLRIRYKDYQAWQAGEKSREALQAQEKYWLKEFETGCPELNLPLDFQRPANRDFQGSHIAFRVGPAQLDRLKALAAGEEATLFMVLLSIYTILISMISTREDIVVGTGVAGRRHSDLEHIIGMFINMLPIRNYPGGEKPFIKFLREVKKQTLEAFENQDYPYEELVSKVNTGKRQANRNALFDVVFELQTMEIPFVRIPGLEIKSYPLESRLSRFDMSWVGEEVDGELIFDVEYRTKLFKKETIQGFIGFFKEILAAVLEDREILLKDIRISHGLLSPKSQKPDIRLRF
jgi:polyketide synthase PksN